MVSFSGQPLRYTVGQDNQAVAQQQQLDLSSQTESNLVETVVGILIAQSPGEVRARGNIEEQLQASEVLQPYLVELAKRVSDYKDSASKLLRQYLTGSLMRDEQVVSLLLRGAVPLVVDAFNRGFVRNVLFNYLLAAEEITRAISHAAPIPEKLIRYITVFLAFLAPLLFVLLIIEKRRQI